MFGEDDLKRLIECAKRALEREDRHLLGCFKERRWKGSGYGICANWNERYYQFLIWSELMRSFRWRPVLEWELHDFAFFDNETDTLAAVAEIKLWASTSGYSEIESIRGDINGFATRNVPGVMLVFTAQLVSEAKDNFDFLAEQLAISRSRMEIDSFPISTTEEGDWEFALVGMLFPALVSPQAI